MPDTFREKLMQRLDESKRFGKTYDHPLDYPNHSPFHDSLVKSGMKHVNTDKRTISSADGVEHTYHYSGPASNEKAVHKALKSKGMTSDDGKSFRDEGRKHGLVHVAKDGDKLNVHHYLSG